MYVKKLSTKKMDVALFLTLTYFAPGEGGGVSDSQRHTNVMVGCTDTSKR